MLKRIRVQVAAARYTIALERTSWQHVGRAQAGPKVTNILSMEESCRRLKLPLREYLAAVLPNLADRNVGKLAELAPIAWASRSRELR